MTKVVSTNKNQISTSVVATRLKIFIFALLAAVALLSGLVAYSLSQSANFDTVMKAPSIGECTEKTSASLDQRQAPTIETFESVLNYCYSFARDEDLMKDFTIRKLNFAQQYRANGILMWIVVLITVCGVVLAAFQIISSYRLVSAAEDIPANQTELILTRDTLALKSSVTGLFILAISFAFFLAFVIYVYRFEKVDDQEDAAAAFRHVTLPIGALGPVPAAQKK